MVDQLEKPQVGGRTKMWLGVAALVMAVLFAVAFVVDNNRDTVYTPSIEDDTRSALESVWADMSTSERIDFCTQARAAGYELVVDEVTAGNLKDPREVRWWLEDRCG